MSDYERDFAKMNPRAVARECSPLHIENVIIDMLEEIVTLRMEKYRAEDVIAAARPFNVLVAEYRQFSAAKIHVLRDALAQFDANKS